MSENDDKIQSKEPERDKLAVGGEVVKKRSSMYILQKLEEHNQKKALEPIRKVIEAQPPHARYSHLIPESERRYSRRLSTIPGVNLNNRKSVDMRKSALRLSRYDEVNPLIMQPADNVYKKVYIKRFLNQLNNTEDFNKDESLTSRPSKRISYRPSTSYRKSIFKSNVEPYRETSGLDEQQQSQTLTNKLKRLTIHVAKKNTSKEERKIRSTFNVFCFLWALAQASALYGIISQAVRQKDEKSDIEKIIVFVVQVLFTLCAILIPRGILRKKFRERVEKGQRFQNLRNAFLEKEVDELNKGLQLCLN